MTHACEESPKVVPIGADTAAHSPVIARIPQGLDATINVRLLPERTLDVELRPLGCQPRQGAPRRNVDTVPLPPELSRKLKDAGKAVIAWLAKDPLNATAFFNDPVNALAEAGIALERADLKALARAHQSVRDVAVIPPGTAVSGLAVAAVKKGKVGAPKPTRPDKTIDC